MCDRGNGPIGRGGRRGVVCRSKPQVRGWSQTQETFTLDTSKRMVARDDVLRGLGRTKRPLGREVAGLRSSCDRIRLCSHVVLSEAIDENGRDINDMEFHISSQLKSSS